VNILKCFGDILPVCGCLVTTTRSEFDPNCKDLVVQRQNSLSSFVIEYLKNTLNRIDFF